MDSDLVLLVTLVLVAGGFSAAEIALTSLSKGKVRALENDHRFGSRAIVALKKKPQNTLVTILIANNVVNVLATVVATVWGLRVFGDNALGIVTGAVTFIILVFGEITPKTFAQKFSEPVSRAVAYPLLWLSLLFRPINWIFIQITRLLMKLFKVKGSPLSTSHEELLAMVDIGAEEGVIDDHEQELIENVLEFDETVAEEIMTGAPEMDVLESSTSIHDAAQFFIDHSHSRIPVYKGDLDNVIGIVTVHDILRLVHRDRDAKKLEEIPFEAPIVVPTTKAIADLFREFQKRRKHIAIVVDERGKTVGLVTMEDILEELVGDIVDEYDQERKRVYRLDKNTWETEGDTPIEEVNEALELELQYPEHQTVSLLILEELNRFPKQGEKIPYENLIFQVTEVSKKRIEKVTISRLETNGDSNTK